MAYNDIAVTEEMGKLKRKGYVSLAGVFEKLRSSTIDESDKEVYGNLHDVCMLSYHNGDSPLYIPTESNGRICKNGCSCDRRTVSEDCKGIRTEI